uniref:HIT-type domain-containing protein n=1 Tax=Mola mola TaxID=94237 RepID=A0A3Q3W733_MOLML
MNPVVRRRVPPSLKSLLTDIGPRKEWTETEPETMTRDGIMLPSRGDGQDRFLRPVETRGEEEEEEGGRSARSAVCMFCKCKPSCYTCPRCNLHYCSLSCYQSPDHSACSEKFYKEAVLQELKDMGSTESEGRKKMQEILVRLRQTADRKDGGTESLLKEAGIVSDDADAEEVEATENVRVLELLSRLAELQHSGEENTTEGEAILRKLEEIGGGDAEGDLDLADRLSGLDIDKLSEEELWELLNSKEKEMFMGLMKSGGLAKFIPLWKPWWEEHEEGGRALVEVHKEGSTHHSVPPISVKIPKLSSLCANPSPLICYGLVNALYAYTFTLCMVNNDTDSLMFEFCDMILALSEAMSSSKVFNSVQEALDRGETLILGGGYLDKEDPFAPARALEAVAHIMTGRDTKDTTGYCLAALSQLRSVLSQARKTLSKEGEEGEKRQKYFLASKKCEFFQAWALDNAHWIQTLATELWNEHRKRENARNNMEKAKTVVKRNLKKETSKRNTKLIEELDK